MTTLVVLIICFALVFDYINGFHDAANSIATVVSTRVLSPRAAVVWAAFFNFAAFMVFPSNVSAALYSLGHGGNDAQKTMGIITLLLISTGLQPGGDHVEPQMWVVLLCHAAMGLGTLSGGWRIVRTMGMKITKLKPVGGFCAETSGAITLALAVFVGVPVSTTHTITGSIVGVGASERRFNAVRWGVAGRIVWAWVLTIPAAGTVASLSYFALRLLTGQQ